MSQLPAISHPYPWQEAQWRWVLQIHAQNKLPHALLLAGSAGVGKAHFARSLAHYLLCLSPQNSQPCGSCRGCELNQAETHPDIVWLSPEESGKAIKVQQVRQLTEFLSKTSQQGGYKIAVISPAESMNVNAANALLKSLEEPTGDSLILLVTHTPNSVMATVRSRCQRMMFSLPPKEQAIEWLTPLVTQHHPDELLDIANGAPLEALALLDGDLLEQRKAVLSGLIELLEGKQSVVQVVAKWMKFDLVQLVNWILNWLQQGTHDLYASTGIARDKPLNDILHHIQPVHLFRFIEKVMETKRLLLSGANPNKQLILEELMLAWCAVYRAGGLRRLGTSGHQSGRQSQHNGLS